MSHIDGRKYICDRCAREIFCKCVGEKTVDGGFTRWIDFEPLPNGWEHKPIIGLLCCDCNNQYESMMKAFMEV